MSPVFRATDFGRLFRPSLWIANHMLREFRCALLALAQETDSLPTEIVQGRVL